MYNNASKHDHLGGTEDFKKNERSCNRMYQNMIIYEKQKSLRKKLR